MTESFQALTAVINRIAHEINIPLDAAAELFKAISAYTEQQVSDAVAAERESIIQLALHKRAVYCLACDGAPCGYDDILRPFADLLTEEPAD